MKKYLFSLLMAPVISMAGVIGGTHDNMGVNMGPVVNHSYLMGSDNGSNTINIKPTGATIDKQSRGSFRTTCKPTKMDHIDPLVYPGKKGASHLHTFFGNTDINENSTAESIANTGNSTCKGGIANRTAYWVPSLIDTRTGAPVVPEDMGVYYKGGGPGISPETVQPLPPGLRMIAGNAKSAVPQSGARTRWSCKSSATVRITDTMAGSSIPNCPVGSYLMQEVFFPSCWNGIDLDSVDHKSHMEYPNYYTGCPSTHPNPLPVITFNVHYKVTDFGGYVRLSSDMYQDTISPGYSSHGDWWNGWNPEVMLRWNTNCNNMAFDCHVDLLGDGTTLY